AVRPEVARHGGQASSGTSAWSRGRRRGGRGRRLPRLTRRHGRVERRLESLGYPSSMTAQGGTKAVVAALLANLGIAITKFGAWALTGASSMLAEGVHSLADSGNQALLLLG